MIDANGIKILLIEDNAGDARLIREALATTGEATEVQCTDRLAKGLEMIEHGRFDAVLLDLSLPDSRGFSTFEQLHRKRQTNTTLEMGGDSGYWLRAAQAAGVTSASCWMEMSARPGNTAPR
jgi:CheY-like chemotaxis protein